jgi:hypothetical protein
MAWWENYPWRMIQTNLREIDMEDISANRFVDDLLYFNANVVLLNAAGIIASYPTKLSYHKQSEYLRGDSLKEIVEACHSHGIRVLARTDFSKVHKSIYEQYPHWAFRTEAGDIMEYNDTVQCCINGDYQQKYAFEIIRELFEEIPFDGLFCNMGGFQTKDYDFRDYGYCHCDSCREKFRQLYEEELPAQEDLEDPVYGKYLQFQERVFKEYRERLAAFVKEVNPELCFDDSAYARIEAATEYKTRLPHWQYHASSNCRAILGDGTSNIICSNTSVDYIGYAFRHVSVSPALQELRLWQNLTNLGALDYYIIGRLDNHLDRSSFPKIKKVYDFHAKHQKEYLGLKSKAEVLVKRTHRWVTTPEEKGWIRVLTESHIPFAELLPEDFRKVDLLTYRLLILPDIKYISEEEGLKIDTYVKQGGVVLATGDTGLYDPYTGLRENQLLQCLGVKQVKAIQDDLLSAMFLVEKNEKEIFTSYKEVDVIPVGEHMVINQYKEGTQYFMKLILPHRYGPPEYCYYTGISEQPGVTRYDYGKGYSIYLPWLCGTFYNLGGHSNPSMLMKDVLMELCNISSIAEGLSSMVEVSLSERWNGELFIQMVNNSGCFGQCFFEPIPIYECRLQIPSKRQPVSAHSITTGKKVSYTYDQEKIYLMLEELKEYEGITVCF